MTALPSFIEPLGQGRYAIDTGFIQPRFAAAYLLVDDGRAAFIDTGTNYSVPRLLQALSALGLGADAVDWVIPTHVHLDHAGGAGLLMQALPHARMAVHSRGARHMADPRDLYAGATAVYGEAEMQRTYGTLVPVSAERITATHDGMALPLGSRTLECIDTPGHARHHHCVWDANSRTWFTGDTFGLAYTELAANGRRWITPTCTPVQFDPEAMKASIERLLARDPAALCVTHYGLIDHAPHLKPLLLSQIDELTAIAQQLRDAPQRHQQLRSALEAMYQRRFAEHGITQTAQGLELLSMDIELNAQGLACWLDRPQRVERAGA